TLDLTLQVEYQQQLVTITGEMDTKNRFAVLENPDANTQVLVAQVFRRTGAFPLAMPVPMPDSSRYDWSLQDFFVNAAGDVIGLVVVSLRLETQEIAILRHKQGGAIEPVDDDVISFKPPIPDLFYFVVNLSERTVLGKSCADTVAVTFETRQVNAPVD